MAAGVPAVTLGPALDNRACYDESVFMPSDSSVFCEVRQVKQWGWYPGPSERIRLVHRKCAELFLDSQVSDGVRDVYFRGDGSEGLVLAVGGGGGIRVGVHAREPRGLTSRCSGRPCTMLVDSSLVGGAAELPGR